jgi:alpha-amylase
VRKQAKLSSKCTIVVLRAAADVYAAIVDGKIVVKIGGGNYSPNSVKLENKQWERVVSGQNFAVWKAGAVLP